MHCALKVKNAAKSSRKVPEKKMKIFYAMAALMCKRDRKPGSGRLSGSGEASAPIFCSAQWKAILCTRVFV